MTSGETTYPKCASTSDNISYVTFIYRPSQSRWEACPGDPACCLRFYRGDIEDAIALRSRRVRAIRVIGGYMREASMEQ